MRWIGTRVSLLLAFVSFAIGLALVVIDKRNGHSSSGLTSESRLCYLGDVDLGAERLVQFRLTNPNSSPVRFVGKMSYCTPELCVSVKNLPDSLAARSQFTLDVGVKVGVPGAFTSDFTLYSDDPKTPQLKLVVAGTGVEHKPEG